MTQFDECPQDSPSVGAQLIWIDLEHVQNALFKGGEGKENSGVHQGVLVEGEPNSVHIVDGLPFTKAYPPPLPFLKVFLPKRNNDVPPDILKFSVSKPTQVLKNLGVELFPGFLIYLGRKEVLGLKMRNKGNI